MTRERAAFAGIRIRRSVPAPFLLFIAAFCVSLPVGNAADWPMFRGNPARTGYTSEQAAPPLAKAWEFSVPGGIVSSPAVYDGIVYIGSRANRIYALDAATGALRWERLTAGWVDSSPTVSGGAVYAACLGGRLYAIDRLTGALLWIRDLGAASASSPLVLDGKVYVGTGAPESKLKVYDAATGTPLGSFQAAQPVDSAPATDGSALYFGANDGSIFALSAATLLPLHTAYPTLGSFGIGAVAVSSGSVYALPGRDEKKALRLSLSDWSLQAVSPELTMSGPWTQAGSPAVAGDRLYFAAGAAEAFEAEAQLAALEAGGLTAVWASSRPLGGVSPIGVLASPALANDILYAATPGGSLLAVSSAGVELESIDISSPAYSSPAVSNGMVIVANYGGKVFGFRSGRYASISSPAAGYIASGTVSIRGYLSSTTLAGYELEYSTGGAAPQWTVFRSSATVNPVANGELASWDVSALDNGLYTLRLRVLESSPSGFDSSASIQVRVNAAPQPPSGLSASDVPGDTGNTITLSWVASPSAGISAYRIYREAADGFSLLASTGATSYTDASAVTGSTFSYVVTAFDGWLESERSYEVYACAVNNSDDTTPPSPVRDFAASPGFAPGTASLTWVAPGDDGDLGQASYYLIKRSTDPAQDWGAFNSLSGSNVTADGPAGMIETEDIGGLFGGVTYYFAIKAVDLAGNPGDYRSTDTWASLDYNPPAPPSSLAAADAPDDEGGRLALSWALSPDDGGGAGDVYGYKIYRRTVDTSYVSSSPYASVASRLSSYTDPDAPLNIRYYYSLAAFDSSNNSVLTDEASGVSADNWRFFDSSRGGTVSLADGTEVTVPADAASQNDKIMVYRLDPLTYQRVFSAMAAGPAKPTGIVYEVKFQNTATRLLAPARISLPYTDAEVAGMATENLRVYTLSGAAWVMLNTSSVDITAKKVSAEVSHFSTFGVMEYVPSGSVLAAEEVYTYPNPARGDTVTFKFRSAYKADVAVDVYNVAGEKVARLEQAACPAGVPAEIVWNTRNIASGVYVYRVKAASAAGTKTIEKKLAIIH